MKLLKRLLVLMLFSSIGFTCFSKPVESVNAEELYNKNEILKPIWEGKTSYNESVLVVEKEDGSIAPITLLYDATEIIKVQNARLTTTYTPEVDYSLENGKLIVKKSGSIPRLTYHEMHPTSLEELEYDDPHDIYEAYSGGYINWHEGSYYHDRQIVVTYKHNDKYKGYIPEGKLNFLPHLKKQLESKKNLNMLVYGDSISVGRNSSSYYNISPFMPTYINLFKGTIEENYGIKISVVNESIAGKKSSWALEEAPNVIKRNKAKNFDLIIVAFGMNDGFAAYKTARNVKKIVDIFQEKYENADFILIGTMLPNEDCIRANKNQKNQAKALKKYEAEKIVVCDVTHVHEYLLSRKSFADMTGNNINHCNDYLARVYAMCLNKTLTTSSYKPQKGLSPLALGLIIGGSALLLIGSGVATFFIVKKRKLKATN